MNIILVSGTQARARTILLSTTNLLLGVLGVAVTVVALAVALQYAMLRFAADIDNPLVNNLILKAAHEQNARMQTYLRENLNAMATRLGQMQAQLVRLDTLGERLAKVAGFKPQDFMFDHAPGRGGAESSLPAYPLSLDDLNRQVDLLNRTMEDRTDKLGVLDSVMTLDSAKKKLVPSVLPVQGGWHSSTFGWRMDPFSATQAFHEGMDFMAESGTAVHAAAGGIVITAEFHPQYGNIIEIAHGNSLVTRYGHLSKRLVKVGDVVLSGGKVGEVGSTGRATGPHLHFEVRQNGAPLNPMRFLRLPG